MSLVRSLLTALTLLLGAHVAHAQVGCVPNPNLNGPPFDNGRPVPAQGLNMLAPLNGPSFINSLSVIASGTPLSAPVTALNVPTLTCVFPGTSPLAFNTASFGSLLAPDSINAGTAEVDGGFRNYYVGGATLQGPRVMRRDQMFFTAASSASNAAHAYTLGADLLDVKSADLGTGTTLATAKGGFYTYNPYAIAENGATNLLELTTGEANISAHAGSSMAVKYGFSIVPDQLDAVRGSVEDAALGISAIAGGTAFWANGISFSDGNGQFPLTTDS
jgi:hypothetical protein